MKNRNLKTKRSNKGVFVGIGFIIIVIIAFIALKGVSSSKSSSTAEDLTKPKGESTSVAGNLKILKSEISGTAKFYPIEVNNTKMEVLAVKASDGTIRTAFNTCQVCYGSGKGYYKQVGNELICENCGNKFKLDQVEKVKNGCNPIPIFAADKTDDGTNIIISKDFLAKYKDIFAKWKTKI